MLFYLVMAYSMVLSVMHKGWNRMVAVRRKAKNLANKNAIKKIQEKSFNRFGIDRKLEFKNVIKTKFSTEKLPLKMHF